MIHLPPEAFVRAAERNRMHQESRESSSAVPILGWAAAGLLTLGVHVGLYLLLTRQAETPAAPLEMPAAVMIDMSPEPTVAQSATDNASNEPEAQNTEQAEPEPAEEAPPPPDPEPVVEAPPPPPQVKPEAVLPPTPPKEVKKPEPKKPEPKPLKKKAQKKPAEPVVQKKDRPSAASRNGGGPRSDQQNAARTAASAAGAAVSQASRASWQNEMRTRIVRAKRFPAGAAGASGIAVVSVTFSGSGSVSSAQLIRSSGNAALDAEAVAVMHRAAPFPPPPGGQAITQTIPLNFSRR